MQSGLFSNNNFKMLILWCIVIALLFPMNAVAADNKSSMTLQAGKSYEVSNNSVNQSLLGVMKSESTLNYDVSYRNKDGQITYVQRSINVELNPGIVVVDPETAIILTTHKQASLNITFPANLITIREVTAPAAAVYT